MVTSFLVFLSQKKEQNLESNDHISNFNNPLLSGNPTKGSTELWQGEYYHQIWILYMKIMDPSDIEKNP